MNSIWRDIPRALITFTYGRNYILHVNQSKQQWNEMHIERISNGISHSFHHHGPVKIQEQSKLKTLWLRLFIFCFHLISRWLWKILYFCNKWSKKKRNNLDWTHIYPYRHIHLSKKKKIKSEINICLALREGRWISFKLKCTSTLELSDFFINLIIEQNIYLARVSCLKSKFHFANSVCEMVWF